MSDEAAKLLTEAMNKLTEALAKSGNQTVINYHYYYPYQANYPVYPTHPFPFQPYYVTTSGMTSLGVAQ